MKSSIEKSIPSCIHEYTTEENEGGSFKVNARCIFPKDFVGFEGHFHNNPVLPAIVQLATVRKIVEKTVAKSLFPLHFTRAKFRAMIKPEQQIFFQITIAHRDKQFEGKFKIRTLKDEAIAEGNYVFCETLQ